MQYNYKNIGSIVRIKHLRNNQIDKQLWDKTLIGAKNYFITAESWFLDVTFPNWEALVSDDYKYIMPLTVKNKYGLKYIVQPEMTQQLGVFSHKEITTEIINLFIQKIPYLSYSINLNEENFTSKSIVLPNYILNLNQGLSDIENGFSKNTKRNIQKSQNLAIKIDNNVSISEFLSFYFTTETYYNKYTQRVVEQLVKKGVDLGKIGIIGARNEQLKLIASLAYLKQNKRIIYWLPISNKEGKEKSAMFGIMYEIIKKYSNQEILLDFEGSKIDGIARFYKGFGGIKKPYYLIEKNRPKWLINLFKRNRK